MPPKISDCGEIYDVTTLVVVFNIHVASPRLACLLACAAWLHVMKSI